MKRPAVPQPAAWLSSVRPSRRSGSVRSGANPTGWGGGCIHRNVVRRRPDLSCEWPFPGSIRFTWNRPPSFSAVGPSTSNAAAPQLRRHCCIQTVRKEIRLPEIVNGRERANHDRETTGWGTVLCVYSQWAGPAPASARHDDRSKHDCPLNGSLHPRADGSRRSREPSRPFHVKRSADRRLQRGGRSARETGPVRRSGRPAWRATFSGREECSVRSCMPYLCVAPGDRGPPMCAGRQSSRRTEATRPPCLTPPGAGGFT